MNSYLYLLPTFITIYVYSPSKVGAIYFLKESTNYKHFLAYMLNNLSDVKILNFKIDVV